MDALHQCPGLFQSKSGLYIAIGTGGPENERTWFSHDLPDIFSACTLDGRRESLHTLSNLRKPSSASVALYFGLQG